MASAQPTPAGGSAAALACEDDTLIHLALPKGHMQENVFKLLEEAGVKVSLNNARGYRPTVPLPNYDCKLLKPQNILGMLDAGVRDLGFAGADWMTELGIEGLVEVLDTGLDPVRIVAAAPDAGVLAKGVGAGGRRLIVASEYSGLTKRWLASRGIEATFLRAYGATEALPPEDADIIVDNAATGSTLKANSLEILDTLMTSTTRMYASKEAWANPAKRARIEKLAILLRAVLDARKRLMVSFNLPADKIEQLGEWMPWCVWGWGGRGRAGGRAGGRTSGPFPAPPPPAPIIFPSRPRASSRRTIQTRPPLPFLPPPSTSPPLAACARPRWRPSLAPAATASLWPWRRS
jgi:ATP phosphoribosyltransferase